MDAQVKQIPQEPNQDPSARWDEWMYLMAFLIVVLQKMKGRISRLEQGAHGTELD